MSDELCSLTEPPDRHALCGILFVLHTGIQREYLPRSCASAPA
ncbi:hypothetical protein [Streptomyces sp. NBC_00316]